MGLIGGEFLEEGICGVGVCEGDREVAGEDIEPGLEGFGVGLVDTEKAAVGHDPLVSHGADGGGVVDVGEVNVACALVGRGLREVVGEGVDDEVLNCVGVAAAGPEVGKVAACLREGDAFFKGKVFVGVEIDGFIGVIVFSDEGHEGDFEEDGFVPGALDVDNELVFEVEVSVYVVGVEAEGAEVVEE